MRELITKLFAFGSQNTYYQWKKQNRPIIKLIEKYFSAEEIKEFLETGEISKYKYSIPEVEEYIKNELEKLKDEILNIPEKKKESFYIEKKILNEINKKAEKLGITRDDYIKNLIIEDIRKQK